MMVVMVVIMCVIAIDNMRRHELVKYSGDDLNAEEAPYKAGHHYEAGSLPLYSAFHEIAHRRRKHAVESREEL
jgi:hypothetical protein